MNDELSERTIRFFNCRVVPFLPHSLDPLLMRNLIEGILDRETRYNLAEKICWQWHCCVNNDKLTKVARIISEFESNTFTDGASF